MNNILTANTGKAFLIAAISLAFAPQKEAYALEPPSPEPCYCTFPARTDFQQKRCEKAGLSTPKPVKFLDGKKCHLGIIYPIEISNPKLVDAGGTFESEARVVSLHKGSLEVTKANESPEYIFSYSIISWSAQDQSTVESSPTGSVNGAILGGLICGIICAPIGAAIGADVHANEKYLVSIEYLNPALKRKRLILAMPNLGDWFELKAHLASDSGLKAGELSEREEVVERLEPRAIAIKKELQAIGSSDAKRPWCLKKPVDESNAKIYTLLLKEQEIIEKQLTSSCQKDSVDKATDASPWKAYLAENPKIAAWAKANPIAAQKLSLCPK